MNKVIHQLNKDQGGQMIVIVLVLFAIGAIVIAPLASQVYSVNKLVITTERNLMGNYAIDAGIEYGLWQLCSGSSGNINYSTTINGVNVTIAVGQMIPNGSHPDLATSTVTTTGAGKTLSSTATRVWTNYPTTPAVYQVYRDDN